MSSSAHVRTQHIAAAPLAASSYALCRSVPRGASHREPNIRNFQSLSIYWRTQMVRAWARPFRFRPFSSANARGSIVHVPRAAAQLELEAAGVANLTSKQMFLACHVLTEVRHCTHATHAHARMPAAAWLDARGPHAPPRASARFTGRACGTTRTHIDRGA